VTVFVAPVMNLNGYYEILAFIVSLFVTIGN